MSSRKPLSPDHLPDHMARWISGLNRRMGADLSAVSGPEWHLVRGGHRMLLSLIAVDGSRVTDLAKTARMTKQSLGESLDLMQADGLVISGRDPKDGRVRLISRTDKGDRVLQETEDSFRKIESTWRKQVGAQRYETMKQVIRELAADQF